MDEKTFAYCESCGVELKKPEDHGGGDSKNKWCKECCNPDGSHKTRDDIKVVILKLLQSADAQVVMGERLSAEEANGLIEDYMNRMPAWKKEEKEE